MKVLMKNQCLLFVFTIILSTYVLSVSAGPAKDHKKKLLEKLRNALNQTELEEAENVQLDEVNVDKQAENNATVVLDETPEAKTTSEEESSEKSEKESSEKSEEESNETGPPAEAEDNDDKKSEEKGQSETAVAEVQKNEGPASYLRKNLVRMKGVLKRIFDLFGFRQSKKKEGRQDRMLGGDDSYSYNGLEYEYFRDDIRTTVGAVLGEKECIQKIVCGAGSYLRDVNGKHVILTVLENVTPSAWLDTMELLKKSAVTDGDCHYKCLEDSDDHDH